MVYDLQLSESHLMVFDLQPSESPFIVFDLQPSESYLICMIYSQISPLQDVWFTAKWGLFKVYDLHDLQTSDSPFKVFNESPLSC